MIDELASNVVLRQGSAAATRHVVAFDTETCLIRPALMAPPLVCVTYARSGSDPCMSGIRHVSESRDFLRELLQGPRTLIVGHNIAFDMAAIGAEFPELVPIIFRAYREDRITDTKLRAQLLDIAAGCFRGRFGSEGKWLPHGYTLDECARRSAGLKLKKDGWRMLYSRFRDVPIAQWPERAAEIQIEARGWLTGSIPCPEGVRPEDARAIVEGAPEDVITYSLDDARATLAVYQAQEKHAPSYLADQFRQARAAWALHLTTCWGMRTDEPGVLKLQAETKAALEECEAELRDLHIVREDGSRDTKVAKARMIAVCQTEGLKLRRTAAHDDCDAGDGCREHVCLDADACDVTGDEVLKSYAELSTLKKVLSNDVQLLLKGVHWPVHPSYGLAETGRTTCRPNIQNLRREAGIREAFVPRAGKVFFSCDYPSLELYTLAQCCKSWIGFSKLGDALNAGLDPHTAMAANILGIAYEEAKARVADGDKDVDRARQTSKVANFGIPGGLGIEKLILFAWKTYKVKLDEAQAKTLKGDFLATWTEMPCYFQRINCQSEQDGRGAVETLYTRRHRGDATYCARCNNGFQALGADCAKNAMWLVSEAQHTDTTSPLWNTRTVAFVHDEIVGEAHEAGAHDAAHELARLMAKGANVYLPDVPIPVSKMKPVLMRRLSKSAKQVWGNDRLVPWVPPVAA